MKKSIQRKASFVTVLILTAALLSGMVLGKAKPNPTKIRIGHSGSTCEAPLFIAYEKGFYQEEGLDVELLKGDFNINKEGLATGKIDVSDGLPLQWIKPIEQGLDIKFTAGIHTGCIRVLVPLNSEIKTVKDFKGKTIGVPAIGGGPMNLVSRLLVIEGINIKTEVTWKAYPVGELELAINKGEVDIIALTDPVAQKLVDTGKFRTIVDSATHEHFKDEYCCLIVIRGKLIKEAPETAAAVTRAILKSARWVAKNPQEAAKIVVDKKYVAGTAEFNGRLLAGYNYIPSVVGGEKAVYIAAKEVKDTGILNPETDPAELAKKAFVKLKGVE